MNDYIKKEDLDTVGITLADDQVVEFLAHANETLEERIGVEITASLDEEQVDQMIEVQQSGDDAALQAWLIQNVPDLNEIVQDETDILLGELAAQ